MHTEPVIRTVCPLRGDLLPKGKNRRCVYIYVYVCVYIYLYIAI